MSYGANFDPLTNYDSTRPLVTTVVVTHPGDWNLLPRALASLQGQLPAGLHEVIVMHDGPRELSQEEEDQLFKGKDFAADYSATPEHSGYYTVARNRSMELARGLYIAHMDADNEFAPGHLSGLLRACRIPDPEGGWPHFAYSRRLYVADEGVVPPKYWSWDNGECDWRLHGYITAGLPGGEPYPESPPWLSPKHLTAGLTDEWHGIPVLPLGPKLPLGPSPFIEWTAAARAALMAGRQYSFIDTGDMLVPRSVLYQLSEMTGYVWNSNVRRFGDYELVYRMMGCGFRGRAVDQITNIYHWTGKNLQMTRGLSDVMHIPADVYEKLKAEGKLK